MQNMKTKQFNLKFVGNVRSGKHLKQAKVALKSQSLISLVNRRRVLMFILEKREPTRNRLSDES